MEKVLIVVNIFLVSFGFSLCTYAQSNGPMVERIARFTPLDLGGTQKR